MVFGKSLQQTGQVYSCTSSIATYLCEWTFYSILHKFVPGPEHPCANKFDIFDVNHGVERLWHIPLLGAPTKRIGVIPTPWVTLPALNLGTVHGVGEHYAQPPLSRGRT